MERNNAELHFLDRNKLAEQGIHVPEIQPYNVVTDALPKINDEMRNGLDVKTDMGSPVFTVTGVSQRNTNGNVITVVELKFARTDPTPFSKVPLDD